MSSYISDTLAHFVGRSKSNDDERYNLLKLIIKQGILTSCPDDPKRKPGFEFGSSLNTVDNGEIGKNQNFVCFCDIPDECLNRHISNYSRFGMSFHKRKLIEIGTRPVQYIPIHTKMHPYKDEVEYPEDPLTFFNHLQKDAPFFSFFVALGFQATSMESSIMSCINRTPVMRETILPLYRGIQSNPNESLYKEWYNFSVQIMCLLPYFKFYDDTLSEDDPANYYYEREWRLLGYLEFSMEDIDKIYLPEAYGDRFKQDYPSYTGKFTYL